jgi:hypothetical protein
MDRMVERVETQDVKRTPFILILAASVVGGAAPATRAESRPAAEVRATGPLPDQGLLVGGRRDTVLIGLDGRNAARLSGLRASWFAPTDTARSAAFQELAQVLPERTILAGSHGTWYEFAPSGRLETLSSPRIRLFGDVQVVARTGPTRHGVFDIKLSVETAGRTIVPAEAELRRVSGELAIARSFAVDLRTGMSWTLPENCFPAGLAGNALLEFCGPTGPKRTVTLVSVSPKGVTRTLSHLPNSLYASAAFVSPDGRYVVGMFTPGCGASHGFVIPTAGGAARPLIGEKYWSLQAPASIGLGWTKDDRVVAILQPASKLDQDPKAGVYLIDPTTLTRTPVYRGTAAWAMWNSEG